MDNLRCEKGIHQLRIPTPGLLVDTSVDRLRASFLFRTDHLSKHWGERLDSLVRPWLRGRGHRSKDASWLPLPTHILDAIESSGVSHENPLNDTFLTAHSIQTH